MRAIVFITFLVCTLAVALNDITKDALQKNLEFRVYSNNIRYASNPDKRLPGELPWDERKEGAIKAIQDEISSYPILIGIQEALNNQLLDIINGLNQVSNNWRFYGVGRDDGETAGEYSAIIYNSNDWNLLNGTYKWLSQTPDVPSKYPGAATKRIVTIATFEHVQSGVKVNFLNTHLDQKSQEAREFSTELISSYIESIPNDYPTFLSGDFNSKSTDVAYKTIAELLKDSATVSYATYNDNLHTYSGFSGPQGDNIDFIWSPNNTNSVGGVTAYSHIIIDNLYNGTSRFSDYRPVLAHYEIKY
ncbi:unnamed protein product [Candida verbasci]|uniref:Endonuclease/exonuclease/phosphatase domain-containing protein n=1 Tax=Candida verbasci TaxID=1227364 RepID=A0A9W4TTJ6_9ASCO|nr:unnamed protein product [Candida verbasci]